jgi:hypothetical protein
LGAATFGECWRDFCSVFDVELGKNAREMALDGAIGKEESCRDLPIRLALGDQSSDALLCGCQCPRFAARPLIRLSSERARSAQRAAPMRSKIANASSSVSRASRRRFFRR